MKLFVDKQYGLDFVLYLIDKLKEHILSNVDNKKLLFITLYTEETYNVDVDNNAMLLVQRCLDGITYNIFANKFTIEFDSNEILTGTDAKLIDICKLINYGVLGLGGCSIFTDSFDYFKRNIDLLYVKYEREK